MTQSNGEIATEQAQAQRNGHNATQRTVLTVGFDAERCPSAVVAELPISDLKTTGTRAHPRDGGICRAAWSQFGPGSDCVKPQSVYRLKNGYLGEELRNLPDFRPS